MKTVKRDIYPSFDTRFFSPIRTQSDYVKVILYAAEVLLSNHTTLDPKNERRLYLKIDKMKRLFLEKENVIISIAFPFTTTISPSDEQKIDSITTTKGTVIDYQSISDAFGILSNDMYLEGNSLFNYWLGNTDKDFDENSLELLLELLQFEPSYVRYDYDEEREDGDAYPLNHFDVNYSTPGTYKLGLDNVIDIDKMTDILNVKTNCYYVRK